MPTIASLNIALTATATAFTAGVTKAKSALGGLGSVASKISAPFTGLTGQIVAMTAGAAGLGSAIGALGLGVQLAADAEQAEVAFGVILGGTDKAQKALGELRDFAASTPFEMPELTAASRSLLAFGTAQEELIPTLRMIGDVSAGVNTPVGELAEIFGKARVQGRLFAEDVNQLTGRGIGLVAELAKQYGTTGDVITKLVSEGKVSFEHLQFAFSTMTAEGGQFAGMMEAQSATLAGLWSTLKDTIGTALMEIAQGMIEAFEVKHLVSGLTGFMTVYKDQFVAGTLWGIQTIVEAGAFIIDTVDWWMDGFVGLQSVVTAAIGVVVRNVANMAQAIQATVNMLPGVEVEFADTFSSIADGIESEAVRLREAWRDGNAAADPSQQLATWIAARKEEGRQKAEASKTPTEAAAKPELQGLKEAEAAIGATGDDAVMRFKAEQQKRADALKSAAESPLEKLTKQMDEAKQLFAANLIDQTVFDRTRTKLQGEIDKLNDAAAPPGADRNPTDGAGRALEQGSVEALQAINRFRQGAAGKVGERQLAESKRHTSLLEQLVDSGTELVAVSF